MQLILGDCLEILSKLESESVHAIISDVPYGISFDEWDVIHNNSNSALGKDNSLEKQANGVFKKRGKPLNGWSKADKEISKEYYEWCIKWGKEWYRVAKEGSSVLVFAGRRYAPRCVCALEDVGFIFKDMIAWEKPSAMFKAQHVSCIFNRRGDTENVDKWKDWRVGNLRPLFEPILWFEKPYPIGSTLTDNIIKNEVGGFNDKILQTNIIKTTNKVQNKVHPTQKDVELMETLIKLVTTEGQIVLDSFMGSGTTGVACKNTNRRFIGIEKEEKYYNIAKERIENA